MISELVRKRGNCPFAKRRMVLFFAWTRTPAADLSNHTDETLDTHGDRMGLVGADFWEVK